MDKIGAMVLIVLISAIFTILMTVLIISTIPVDLTCKSYEIYNDKQSIQFRDCRHSNASLKSEDILIDIEKENK